MATIPVTAFSEEEQASVRLRNLRSYTITEKHLESLKTQPGIAFYAELPEKLPGKQIAVVIPDKIGGGYLVGTAGDIADAFNASGVTVGLTASAVSGLTSGLASGTAAAIMGIVLYLYLFAYYSVKTTNLLYNSSRLGPHRMESTMQIRPYLGLVITNSLATALTLGIFHPWAKIRTMRYKLEHLTVKAFGDLDGFVASEQAQVSALGEEAADIMDIDFGL